ncbi:MAG: serine hydrolase domain-containing protein [Gemmatirosa sp.]
MTAAAASARRVRPARMLPALLALATRAAAGQGTATAIDTLIPAPPEAAGFAPDLGVRLDSAMRALVAEARVPGAVLAVGRRGRLVHLRGYGTTDWKPDAPPADASTLYDLASLTKVVATTTVAMALEDAGRLDLDRPVRAYVPELRAPDKAGITVRMLLTHRSGLEAGAPLYATARGKDAYLAAIDARPLEARPGTRTTYGDWNLVLLQAVIERVAGRPLDAVARDRVFGPLGMRDARFRPDTTDAALRRRIAPTDVAWGAVHDPNARAMGGVSGHAGLFATARDLSAFAQMMLNGGRYRGARIASPTTVARWTAAQRADASRALGWDTSRAPATGAGALFSPRSYGHTGFTGTSLWIDPERELFVVLLLHRVHARGESVGIGGARRRVHDLVQQAVIDGLRVRKEPGVALPDTIAPP